MTLVEGTREDTAVAGPVRHPLEPLAPGELSAAAAVLRADPRFPEGTRFVYLELAEPPKDVVLGWTPGVAWDP